jgi:hypothetical protein
MGMGNLMIEISAPRYCFSSSDYREACRERNNSRSVSYRERNNSRSVCCSLPLITVRQYPEKFTADYHRVLREFKEKHQYDLVWCTECGRDFLRKYTEYSHLGSNSCDSCKQQEREYNEWCRQKSRCESCGRKVINKEMTVHQASHDAKRQYAEELAEYGRSHEFLQTVVTRGKHKGKTTEQILVIDPEYFSSCESFTRSEYFQNLAERWVVFVEDCDSRKENIKKLPLTIKQNILERYSWEFIEAYQRVVNEFKEEYTYILVSCRTCGKGKRRKYSKAKYNMPYQCTRCKTEEKQREYVRFLQQKLTRGKHSGKTIGETLEINPRYLLWCAENTRSTYFKKIIEKLQSFEI